MEGLKEADLEDKKQQETIDVAQEIKEESKAEQKVDSMNKRPSIDKDSAKKKKSIAHYKTISDAKGDSPYINKSKNPKKQEL